jgi:hypothetical protein
MCVENGYVEEDVIDTFINIFGSLLRGIEFF